MTQPPSYPTPPVGGPQPAAGGFAPQCLHDKFAETVVVKVSS
ncbi:hypothetical protein AB0J14_21185 [Micromonospora arborensis]